MDDAGVHGGFHAAKKFRVLVGGLHRGEIAEGVLHFRRALKINRLFRRRVLERTREEAADIAAVAGHGEVEIVRAVEGDDGAFTRWKARADAQRGAAEKLAPALGPCGDDGRHAGDVVEKYAQQKLAMQRGHAAQAQAEHRQGRFAVLRGDGFILKGLKPDGERGLGGAGLGEEMQVEPHGECGGLVGEDCGLLRSRERGSTGEGEEGAETHGRTDYGTGGDWQARCGAARPDRCEAQLSPPPKSVNSESAGSRPEKWQCQQ